MVIILFIECIVFKYLIFDEIKTIKKYNLKNVYNKIITNYCIRWVLKSYFLEALE